MKVSQTVPPTVQLHFNIKTIRSVLLKLVSVQLQAPGCLLKSKTIWTIFKRHVQVITQRDKKQDRRNAPPFSIVGYNTCKFRLTGFVSRGYNDTLLLHNERLQKTLRDLSRLLIQTVEMSNKSILLTYLKSIKTQ